MPLPSPVATAACVASPAHIYTAERRGLWAAASQAMQSSRRARCFDLVATIFLTAAIILLAVGLTGDSGTTTVTVYCQGLGPTARGCAVTPRQNKTLTHQIWRSKNNVEHVTTDGERLRLATNGTCDELEAICTRHAPSLCKRAHASAVAAAVSLAVVMAAGVLRLGLELCDAPAAAYTGMQLLALLGLVGALVASFAATLYQQSFVSNCNSLNALSTPAGTGGPIVLSTSSSKSGAVLLSGIVTLALALVLSASAFTAQRVFPRLPMPAQDKKSFEMDTMGQSLL